MATAHPSKIKVLEQGEIYFLYRPHLEEFAPEGLLDIRRFYMVLHPEGQERFRLIAIGKKKLPGSDTDGERHWGFVDGVFPSADELRRVAAGVSSTMGGAENLRPAGEGVYSLVLHGNHTHLAYVLEAPQLLGTVQEAFNIQTEGRMVVAVKNPQAVSPPGVGLEVDFQADFPEELKARFGDRRWTPVDPPGFLDYEGAELVLIGGRDDLGADLGIDLNAHPKDEETAEIFKDLHMEKSERTIKPLFQGIWE
ncbi:MAG: hypothetical protein P4L84_30150 [Isosphaeraceae bacterium]|nr:hypothetical protein [Isosphaeraceae bacterium]